MKPSATATEIVTLLAQTRFLRSSEVTLEDAVSHCLHAAGIHAERQVKTTHGRLDLKAGPVAIELKVKGSLGDALVQARRYLHIDGIEDVIVATTCRWRVGAPPPQGIHLVRLTALF